MANYGDNHYHSALRGDDSHVLHSIYPSDASRSPLNTTAYKQQISVGNIPVGNKDGYCPPNNDTYRSGAHLSPTMGTHLSPASPHSNPQGEQIGSPASARTSTMSGLLATAASIFGLETDNQEPQRRASQTANTCGQDMEYFGFVSAKHGDVQGLETALNAGLNPNAVDSANFTLLMWTARTGAVPTAKLLLQRGAIADLEGGRETATPLILAAKHGYTGVAELFLIYGANPNKPDFKMHTPLIYACANGQFHTARLLLDSGANPNWSARVNGVERNAAMSSLDRQFGLDEGTRAELDWQEQSEGKTALHVAARFGHMTLVELLLRTGSHVDAQDDRGKTAVFWATLKGHEDAVRTLLQFRAHPDVPDVHGNTALMWACRLGHQQIAKMLIDFGAKVNYSSPEDRYRGPLTWAMQYSDKNMVTLLRKSGAVVRSGIAPPEPCVCCFW